MAQVSTQASAAAPSSAIASCSAPPGQVGAGVLSFLDHDSVSSRSVDSSTQAQAPPPNREEADYGTCAGPVQVLAPRVSAQGQAPPPEELETGQAQALAKAPQAKGDTKAPTPFSSYCVCQRTARIATSSGERNGERGTAIANPNGNGAFSQSSSGNGGAAAARYSFQSGFGWRTSYDRPEFLSVACERNGSGSLCQPATRCDG